MRAACALTVSDTLSEEETSEGTYMSLADLEAATDRMIEIALEAGTAGCAGLIAMHRQRRSPSG